MWVSAGGAERPSQSTRVLVRVLLFALFVWLAYAVPSLGRFEGAGFAAIAVLLWFFGAQRRRAAMQRWTAVTNMYGLTPEQLTNGSPDSRRLTIDDDA